MPKIEVTKVELVWPGKYNEDGTLREVPRVSLPFQVIERVNESRATREARKTAHPTLFDIYEGNEGETFEEGWRNKLIWGDNLLVMSSLLEKFAGKIDLIYIDPPFATGADFSFRAPIGEEGEEVEKEPSILEEKAYRDTWGRGLDSYLTMMRDRLTIMRDLLCETGSILIHLDDRVSPYIKAIMDELFGIDNFVNEIVWRRVTAHGARKGCGRIHDVILWYAKSDEFAFFQPGQPLRQEYIDQFYRYKESDGRRYQLVSLNAKGPGPARSFGGRVIAPPPGTHWRWSQERIDEAWRKGLIVITKGGAVRYKQYLDEHPYQPVQSIWDDEEVRYLGAHSKEVVGFETQKPEGLLQRIVKMCSAEGGLVADFFCGSGTTLAVAEKLGRRWIGCDLSRWAIHVTRKRLLDIPNCKPFEVLNLGKYERQYWTGITFGGKSRTEKQVVYDYLAFFLKLYGAQPVAGMAHLHGKKGNAMVHIGAVDAPVTIGEINAAIDECVKVGQKELHVLGWEWEMGLAGPNNDLRKGGLMHEIARQKGVKLVLLQIPREVMEKQAVEKGDVKFYELAYFRVEFHQPRQRTLQVELKEFASPNMDELIPEEIRAKVKKWSDYIDYWAIDWDFQHDTFMQGWVAYRTRKNRQLPLISDPHTYEKPGNYRVLVKVIDIFGNDSSQAYEVEVK
jgi:DNA modification methylase